MHNALQKPSSVFLVICLTSSYSIIISINGKRYRNMGRVLALTSQASFQIVSIYQPHRFARDSVCPSLPFAPSLKKEALAAV